jgi:hypothetical protein
VSHFLELEPLIVAQIQPALPAGVRAMTAADIAAVKSAAPASVYVLFNGFTPKEPRGALIDVEQHWMTIVAVRNQRTLSADGAAAEAGPLMTAVIDALLHHAFTGYKRLRMTSGPAPMHDNGMAYYPIGWTTAKSLQGGCQ